MDQDVVRKFLTSLFREQRRAVLFTPVAFHSGRAFWRRLVLLMGLAAGIDYALFLFTRYRFERDRGRDPTEAAAIASNTAGKGVLIAAVTTMLAILGMFLVGDPVFTSLGIAAVVTIFVALLMALTLMPALLSDNLSRWRLPWLRNHNVAISGSLNRAAGSIVPGTLRRAHASKSRITAWPSRSSDRSLDDTPSTSGA